MIIPVRCFSCGSLIAHRWVDFQDKIESGIEVSLALDEVEILRYCCRRMYVSHVNLIHEVAPFSASREQ